MPQTVNGGRIQFGVGFKTDTSGLQAVEKSLSQIQNMKFENFKGTEQQFKEMQQAALKTRQILQDAFNADLGTINISKFTKGLNDSFGGLDGLRGKFEGAGVQGQVAFDRVATAALKSNIKLKLTKSLVDSLGQTFMNSIKWNIASSVINSFTGSLQLAFGYVKNLDSSLTNIRIVTGDSRDLMAAFAVEANNAAAALGKTTRDYTDAALSFYQQGLNDEEVRVRTEASLKAQNITQGQASVDELTAVWNGYQVSVAETLKYVDKLAAVADSSASDMSLLATAMSKVAATANVMGVDIDQLTAQIATIVATTRQAPQTVGNALKTIYARINDIKAGTDDAETSLGNYSGKMAALGFSVLDANGNLRLTGLVMEEIGERWATLTNEQQVYLAQTMAGQRQYNQLISLFDNWTQYSEMLNVSLESEGTLNLKNSRYMESLAAHMEQFTAARLNLMDSFFNADSFKNFIDVGTKAVNVIAKLVDAIGGGGNALLMLGTTASRVLGNTVAREVTSLVTNFRNARDNAQLFNDELAYVKNDLNTKGISVDVEALKALYGEMSRYWGVMTDEEKLATRLLIIQKFEAALELKLRQDELASAKLLRDIAKENVKTQETELENLKKNTDLEISRLNIKKQQAEYTLLEARSLTQMQEKRAQAERDQNAATFAKKLVKGTGVHIGDTISGIDNTTQALNVKTAIKDSQREAERASKSLDQLLGNAPATLENSEEWIKKVEQLVEKLKKAMANTPELDKFQEKLKTLSSSNQPNVFGSFKTVTTQLNEKFKQENDQLTAAMLKSRIISLLTVENATREILNIDKAIEKAELAANKEGQALLKNIQKAKLAEKKADKVVLANLRRVRQAESHSQNVDQDKTNAFKRMDLENLTKGFTQLAGGAASVAGAIRGITSAAESFKKGDYLSAFSGGMMSLVAGASGVKNIVEGLKKAGPQLASALTNPFVLMGAAAVTAGVLIYRWYTKESRAAEKAALSAKQATLQYNRTKEAYSALKSEIEDYDSAHKAIEEMTQGTEEWKKAIYLANLQVTELLAKYPLLSKYIERNARTGLLSIDEKGFDELLEKQQEELNLAQQTSLNATNRSLEMNLRASAREISHRSQYYNAATQTTSEVSVDNVLKIAEAFNKDQLLLSKSNLLIADQVGISVAEVIAVMDSEKDLIKNLASLIKTNTLTIRANNNIIADNYLSENNSTYQGIEDETIKNTVADLFANATTLSATNGAYFRKYDQMTDKLVQQEYARRMGYASSKDKFGGHGLYYNAQGLQVADLQDEAVRAALALQDAQEEMGKNISDYIKLAEKLTKTLGDTGSSFIGGQGGNLSGLSEKELDDLGKKDLSKLFSEEDARALGYDNAEAYYEAINEGIANSKANFRQIRQGLSNGLSEAFNSATKDKNLSLSATEMIANLLEKSFAEGGATFSNAISKIFKDLDKEDAEAFANLLSGIDWTQEGAIEQLNLGISDLGINIDTTSPAFLDLINNLSEVARNSVSAGQAIEKIRSILSSISTIKDLELGQVISDEDYEKLLEVNPLLKEFFQIAAEGYQFIGSKENLSELLYGSSGQLEATVSRFKELQATAQAVSNTLLHLSGEERLNESDLTQITAYSNSTIGKQAIQAIAGVDEESLQNALNELQRLRGIDELKMLLADKQKYDKATAIVESYYKGIQQMQNDFAAGLYSDESLSQLMASSSNTLSELRTQQLNGVVYDLDYNKSILAIGAKESLSLGFEPELVADLADAFQKEADTLEEVDDELDEHRDRALEVSQAYKRLERGLEDFTKKELDLTKALSDPSNIGDYTLALTLMQNIMGDILDMDDPSMLSEDFLAGAPEKLHAIADGGENAEQALMDLRALAATDIIQHIELDDESIRGELLALNDYLLSYTQDPSNEIHIGTHIDTDTEGLKEFIDACNSMITAADMTYGLVMSYFSAMGYSADVKMVDGGTQTTHHVIEHTLKRPDAPDYTWTDEFSDTVDVKIPLVQSVTYKGPKGGTVNAAGSGARAARPAPKGGGGGKKGGGGGKSSGSTKKPKQEKPKLVKTDPYHKVNRQLDDQLRKLKKLDDLEDRLIPRDRLAVLEKESNLYQKQIKLLKEKEGIANSLLGRLKTALTKQNASNVKVQFQANGLIANYNEVLKGAYDKYNQWVTNVYNKMTAEQQLAAASLKLARELALKLLEDNLQEYEKTLDLIDDIEDALQAANEAQAALFLTALKYRMQIREAAGDLQREFQDFSDKVINDLADEDYLAQVQSKFDKIMSYVNSKELEERKTQIDILRQELDNINKGIESKYSAAEVQSMLDDLLKQQMSDLLEIKDLQKEIQLQFIDALDNAKDKQDLVMDQYGRINDQIQRGIDLTNKLYGDKAYEMLDKYYEKQNANNLRELQTLKLQENYWRAIMSSQLLGSLAWKAARENLESVIDAFGDKLELALDNLATWWENQVDLLVNNLNNTLTNGLGTDYLDMLWDQMSKFDDDFLDAVNRNFATNEIRDMYQEGLDSLADSPAAQARLNELMNDQLKILEEKENLTQYDIDRAKALYDIEMKRFELEELRNSKTTMRLRRDSQGNYTYQYVEDEEKVSDLQKSLALAENNLYNLDKEHYKETLENMYDVYKEYLEERQKLEKEYTQARLKLERAQTEQDKAAAQERLNQLEAYEETLNKWYTARADAYGEDILYNKFYLGDSIADVLGLTDLSEEDKTKLVDSLVPYATSGLAALAENISSEGGFLLAVIKPVTAELTEATTQLLSGIDAAKGIYDENADVRDAENEFFLLFDVQQMNKAAEQVSAVSDTLKSIDEWLKATFTQEFIDNIVNGVNLVQESNVMKDENSEEMGLGAQGNTTMTPMQTDTSSFNGASTILPMSVTNAEDDTARVDYWKTLLDTQELGTDAYAAALANYEGALQTAAINKLVSSLADYYQDPSRYLSQAVTINADFPNVESWQEIVEAIKNLSLTASQQSSSTIRTAG